NRTDRQVDVENPAPIQIRGKIAADQRPGYAGEAEHPAEDALVAPALARRDDIADDGLRCNDDPAAAESLHGAKENQLEHRAAEARERRSGEKKNNRRLHHALAAVKVAELAVKRRHDRLREQ